MYFTKEKSHLFSSFSYSYCNDSVGHVLDPQRAPHEGVNEIMNGIVSQMHLIANIVDWMCSDQKMIQRELTLLLDIQLHAMFNSVQVVLIQSSFGMCEQGTHL